MRKFFFLCLLFGGYIWMVTTGNEAVVLERGRILYRWISEWFLDADLDFQVKKQRNPSPYKKHLKPKRWD